MSNQEDFLRKARMAALMAADDDEGKDVAPAEDEDALVSEKTKENLKKAGALAAVAGRWGFGKAKEVTKAAAEKASAAKADFEEKRAAAAKRKAEEALAVETKAMAEREAAVPVAEAPPMVVAPVGDDYTDTMAKDHLIGATATLKALGEDEEERGVPDAEREGKWIVPGLLKVLDTAEENGGEPSGLLVLDGMGSLPPTFSQDHVEVVVLEPDQQAPLAETSGEDVETALAAMTSMPQSTNPEWLMGKAGMGMTTIHELYGFSSNHPNVNKSSSQDRREDLTEGSRQNKRKFWILIAGGLVAAAFVAVLAFYIANRETGAPIATPTPTVPQAVPVIVEPVTLPIEAPVEEPAATVLEVVEAPAVVAPPVVQVTPVVVPAPKPTPVAPVVQAPKPAPVAVVAKPKPAPVKAAPAVAAKPKPAPGVADDTDKQLQEIEAWFEQQNKN